MGEYMAPEVLDVKVYYGSSVDWWSLGVLLYKMLMGRPPFWSTNQQELFRMIQEDAIKFQTRVVISDEAKELIEAFLTKDPKARLCGENAKQHPFFDGINWKALEKGTATPPFIPELKNGEADTSNFEKEFTSMKPVLSKMILSKKIRTQCEEGFPDFTYT